MAWLSVRQAGGTLVLRMEDIDPDRARQEYVDAIMQDLSWLGLSWDEGVGCGGIYKPYTQSQRIDRYAEILQQLERIDAVYPCFCTRKELRAIAGAPHLGECSPYYPGVCKRLTLAEREQYLREGKRPSVRLRCSKEVITFHDRRCGVHSLSAQEWGGDFALRRSDGVFAYQLAVVVDDMDMRISEVVRGDDLLHCTPRQIMLQRLLGASQPSYLHVPLLLDHEGNRLAKRHASLTVRSLRERGVLPGTIVGYLAWIAGFNDDYTHLMPQDLISSFDVKKLPSSAIRLEKSLEDTFVQLSKGKQKPNSGR